MDVIINSARHLFSINAKKLSLLFLSLSLPFLASGCGQSFNIKNLAKTDVDMVADNYVQTIYEYNRELMIKLYKRNPRELLKSPGMTIEIRLRQLGATPPTYQFTELNKQISLNAIDLTFDPTFEGDRVFALMTGLRSMLHASFENKFEFYLLDDLDQQKIYNSARNLEIIAWRLNSFRNTDGGLFLLSNGYQGDIPNLSFERIFGKLIGLQDMMAKIVAGKADRQINSVVQGVASTAFFPI